MSPRPAAALAALLAVALAATGCNEKKAADTAIKPVPVNTMAMQSEDVTQWREIMGRTEGRSQVEVRSQVSGLLRSVAYGEGASVKKGDLLFLIEPEPYEASLRQARAGEAQAAAESEQANRELRRARRLFEKKAVTQKELDDATSEAKVASAALQSARAAVESARVSLSHTRIEAASDGVASLALVKPGALVTAQSTLLATLTQTDDIRVVFAMGDRDLGDAVITAESKVEVEDSFGKRHEAKLDYVSQLVDEDLGTRQFRAVLPAGTGLLAGQFVRVRLQTGIERGVFKIPQSAVIQESNGTYSVFVKRGDESVKVPVTVGPWDKSDWIIRSGVNPGDTVITTNILRLRTGRKVTETARP